MHLNKKNIYYFICTSSSFFVKNLVSLSNMISRVKLKNRLGSNDKALFSNFNIFDQIIQMIIDPRLLTK